LFRFSESPVFLFINLLEKYETCVYFFLSYHRNTYLEFLISKKEMNMAANLQKKTEFGQFSF